LTLQPLHGFVQDRVLTGEEFGGLEPDSLIWNDSSAFDPPPLGRAHVGNRVLETVSIGKLPDKRWQGRTHGGPAEDAGTTGFLQACGKDLRSGSAHAIDKHGNRAKKGVLLREGDKVDLTRTHRHLAQRVLLLCQEASQATRHEADTTGIASQIDNQPDDIV
jgi:hypothetical protein